MKYYFEKTITEDEQAELKNVTSQIEGDVAIYMSATGLQGHFAAINNTQIFNDAALVLKVSRNVMFVAKHLRSIIQFLVSRNKVVTQYCFDAQVISPNFVYVQVIRAGNLQGFEIDIVNDNIVSFNASTFSWNTPTLKYDISKCYDLITQYTDFTTSQPTHTRMNVLLPKITPQDSNKTVTIIKNNNEHTINFTNYTMITDITDYLIKNYGPGQFIHNVDLKANIELIKYYID